MVAAVLVYSLSGNTRRVAEAVAARLPASLSTLQAPRVRPGAFAMLRLGYATLFGGGTPVQIAGPDPLRADLLILAAPVWAGRLCVPMRSWLATRPRLPAQVALIMTGGAPKPADSSFADFAARAGIEPTATLYISEPEARAGSFGPACDTFCRSLAALA